MRRKNIEIKQVKEFLNEIGFNWDGTFCSFDYLHRREINDFEQLIRANDFVLLFDNKDHVGYFSINENSFKRFKYVSGKNYEIFADYSKQWKNHTKKSKLKPVEIIRI